MYCTGSYTYHKNERNVGKYTLDPRGISTITKPLPSSRAQNHPKSSEPEPTKRVPQPTKCVSSPHRKDHAHDVPYLEPIPLESSMTRSVPLLKGGCPLSEIYHGPLMFHVYGVCVDLYTHVPCQHELLVLPSPNMKF